MGAGHRTNFLLHITMPVLLSTLFFAVALSPVSLLGCRTRGLVSLALAMASGVLALGAAVRGAGARFRGDPRSTWWLASSLVLTVPVVAMVLMA